MKNFFLATVLASAGCSKDEPLGRGGTGDDTADTAGGADAPGGGGGADGGADPDSGIAEPEGARRKRGSAVTGGQESGKAKSFVTGAKKAGKRR